jgi:hypothetical protein
LKECAATQDNRSVKNMTAALRRFPLATLLPIGCLLAVGVNAQQRDPRVGEWRQDRDSPNAIGLYSIFEELGNGMTRYHIAHNLAPESRLYSDYRCDGNLYPIRDYQGVPTDISWTCTILDAHTVAVKAVRNAEQGKGGRRLDSEFEGEGTGTVSIDGMRYTTAFEQKDDDRVIKTIRRTYTRNAETCLNASEELFRECQARTSPPRK